MDKELIAPSPIIDPSLVTDVLLPPTLPWEQFKDFMPPEDILQTLPVQLKKNDLREKTLEKPKLSIIISTWNRGNQLKRSLECYARQTFRDFEIIVIDDGSSQDIYSIVETYEPHLQIQYLRLKRTFWRSDPTIGITHGLKLAKGEVIGIAHPEIMPDPTCCFYLYWAHYKEFEGSKYMISVDPKLPGHFDADQHTYVTIRPQFIDKIQYLMLDSVNWHDRIHEIATLQNFDIDGGFAGRNNEYWRNVDHCPWWFLSSMRRKEWDCIGDLGKWKGHGQIDMFLITQRNHKVFLDITPKEPLCYHQFHQKTAMGVQGEQK